MELQTLYWYFLYIFPLLPLTSTLLSGIDWDQKTKTNGIYYIEGPGRKNWSMFVDKELGNYDYLLGCDVSICSIIRH